MKIGLVTIYDVPNYGTILQAYATKKILERLGDHSAKMIPPVALK